MRNTAAQALTMVAVLLLCGISVLAQTRVPAREANKSVDTSYVTAQRGDSIARIAAKNGVKAGELSRINHLRINTKLRTGQRLLLPASQAASQTDAAKGGDTAHIIGKRIIFAVGPPLVVDEAWNQGEVVWFSRGGVTQSLDRGVTRIEPLYARTATESGAVSKPSPAPTMAAKSVWIYLVGGARFKVDDVNETPEGAWYHRGTVSVFVDRERIARIEREESGPPAGFRGRDWTSGNPHIDQLIKTNAEQMRLDPYLVFLVIEQESHFRVRAVSPKGARGLMQLMPGTARRFGVKRPFEAAENIRAGTRYLRELMDMFDEQVNLVLASYNAGEGAVLKYGRTVPPYRETRDYVQKIGKRYGLNGHQRQEDGDEAGPQR